MISITTGDSRTLSNNYNNYNNFTLNFLNMNENKSIKDLSGWDMNRKK